MVAAPGEAPREGLGPAFATAAPALREHEEHSERNADRDGRDHQQHRGERRLRHPGDPGGVERQHHLGADDQRAGAADRELVEPHPTDEPRYERPAERLAHQEGEGTEHADDRARTPDALDRARSRAAMRRAAYAPPAPSDAAAYGQARSTSGSATPTIARMSSVSGTVK